MKKLDKVKEANVQLVQQLKDSKEQCEKGKMLYSSLEQVSDTRAHQQEPTNSISVTIIVVS